MEPQTAIDRYRAIWGHRSEWRELLTKVDIDAPIMAQYRALRKVGALGTDTRHHL